MKYKQILNLIKKEILTHVFVTPEQEEKEQQREKGKRKIYKIKKSLAEKRGGK